MKILGIETSCDETALCVIEATGDIKTPETLAFRVLGNELLSQINIHAQYGGVFPAIAKREHSKALIPLLETILKEIKLEKTEIKIDPEKQKRIEKILERELELKEIFLERINKIQKPDIDAIAVTYGPGLEPALWVGINFAKALSIAWDIPIIPTNHMEGHIVSSLTNKIDWGNNIKTEENDNITFPAIALLISGGHTELVSVTEWAKYKIIGSTKDDAVGEAFDKVARILGLPYPGGPAISQMATEARVDKPQATPIYNLPSPMIHSNDFDFSFSGLKTAVLYTVKKIPEITDEIKKDIAREFEDAVIKVLLAKAKKALIATGAKSLIIGGGVSANKEIRKAFQNLAKELGINISIPNHLLSTDNAVMIAIAGYIQAESATHNQDSFGALGNLKLGKQE